MSHCKCVLRCFSGISGGGFSISQFQTWSLTDLRNVRSVRNASHTRLVSSHNFFQGVRMVCVCVYVCVCIYLCVCICVCVCDWSGKGEWKLFSCLVALVKSVDIVTGQYMNVVLSSFRWWRWHALGSSWWMQMKSQTLGFVSPVRFLKALFELELDFCSSLWILIRTYFPPTGSKHSHTLKCTHSHSLRHAHTHKHLYSLRRNSTFFFSFLTEPLESIHKPLSGRVRGMFSVLLSGTWMDPEMPEPGPRPYPTRGWVCPCCHTCDHPLTSTVVTGASDTVGASH